MFEKLHIISLDVQHLSFTESLEAVTELAITRTSSFVCFANAHMIAEAYTDRHFAEQLKTASLVLADGKPLEWACRLLHKTKQERISGMDFLPRMLAVANEKKLSVFFYGAAPGVLKSVQKKIASDFPCIQFAGAISPPYRPMTDEETGKDIEQINSSGAQLVFVSLGCPKQEKWMAENIFRISAVLLGIGGALPVFAGLQTRAPRWMQSLALEWLFRLAQQPRRLFKRYFYTNSLFLLLLLREWLKKIFKR